MPSRNASKDQILPELRIAPDPGNKHAVIPLSQPGKSPVPHRAFISLLECGNMHFQKRNALPARNILFRDAGIDPGKVFGLVQKHTHEVILVTDRLSPDDIAQTEADGLVAMKGDAVLTVTVADCLPIFIIDKKTHAFGIVHSGWKGTGIVMAAICLMNEALGSLFSDLRIVIGPGIGVCCYNVNEERASIFASSFGLDSVIWKNGAPFLDLRRANVNLLKSRGINDIMVFSDCTSCNPLLCSARREGKPDFPVMLAGIYCKTT